MAFRRPQTCSISRRILRSSGVVSGGAQGANFSVIAPVADQLSNSGNVGISDQFALNDMVGASGTFSNLHFPNPTQVPGLYDSSSQGGMAFYSHRVARKQYLGVSYGYQRLIVIPDPGDQRNADARGAAVLYVFAVIIEIFVLAFWRTPVFGYGSAALPPQQLQSTETRSWTPAGGASLGWQGRLNSFALSYTHLISGGGGLIGAVKLDSATGIGASADYEDLERFIDWWVYPE